MCFVDDDGVVLTEGAIALKCREQDSVGHNFDPSFGAGTIGETNLIADYAAQLNAQFFADSLSHRTSGDAPGLSVGDALLAELKAHLWQLSGFSRTGCTRDDYNLVAANRLDDFVVQLADRQVRRVTYVHGVPGLDHF